MHDNTSSLRSLFAALCFCFLCGYGLTASAAEVTLSPSGTDVDSINSITLLDSFATTPVTLGTTRATVFGLTFTIRAYDHALTLPLQIGAQGTHTQTAVSLESRYDTTPKNHLLAGTLIPGTGVQVASTSGTVASGPEGTFTLLVAYAAPASQSDREDRLRVTAMPITFSSSKAPLILNAHEVSDLVSDYVALND